MQSTNYTPNQIQNFTRIRSAHLHSWLNDRSIRYTAYIAPNGFYVVDMANGRSISARSVPSLIVALERALSV